ncbi:MAG: hypothetical protein ABFE07_09715 [Armatimonadia bacterium]
MTDDNGFTYRYAIRRPDGELIPQPKSSYLSGLFGLPNAVADGNARPRTWDAREQAEAALRDIQAEAASIGITSWLGRVEQQLCTPFTVTDPAEHFADEIQQWLQGGAA